MLDQNTDRMWYVIGAVLVGAAIILIANGTLPDIFASVGGSMEHVLVKATFLMNSDFEIVGESTQENEPTLDNPSDIEGLDNLDVGSDQFTLSDYGIEPLHNIGELSDRMFYDTDDNMWKIERNITRVTFGKDFLMRQSHLNVHKTSPYYNLTSIYFIRVPDKSYMTPYKSNYFKGDGTTRWSVTPFDHLGETTAGEIGQLQLIGAVVSLEEFPNLSSFNEWIIEKEESGKPLVISYQLNKPEVEILPGRLQEVMNDQFGI